MAMIIEVTEVWFHFLTIYVIAFVSWQPQVAFQSYRNKNYIEGYYPPMSLRSLRRFDWAFISREISGVASEEGI